MNDHIFAQVQRLQKKYRTSDPFELMDVMNVVTMFSDSYSRNGLKGFCMIQNRTKYVVINNRLPDEEQRVVAAHELGHIVVHNTDLMVGAFKDDDIYMATGKKEREANFFAADFLIADEEVIELMKTCDANFFNVAKALSIPAPFFAFKLYSMVERGYAMHVPVDLDSAFLAH